MNNLVKFCNDIMKLDYSYNLIFNTSQKKTEVCDSVSTIIDNNIETTDSLNCIDFFCGHGHIATYIKNKYNSNVIGIDINRFDDWNKSTDVHFFQKDVFDVLRLECPIKFDIVITFNTLRANLFNWERNNYNDFLKWCNRHTKYLITNNCTNKKLEGFNLIDTIEVPGFYDTNLFKVEL